jgi:hypothetical protein
MVTNSNAGSQSGDVIGSLPVRQTSVLHLHADQPSAPCFSDSLSKRPLTYQKYHDYTTPYDSFHSAYTYKYKKQTNNKQQMSTREPSPHMYSLWRIRTSIIILSEKSVPHSHSPTRTLPGNRNHIAIPIHHTIG